MRATNRAILVLQDMPEQCIQCPCYSDDLEECRARDEDVSLSDAIYVKGRPEWCPLEYVDEEEE